MKAIICAGPSQPEDLKLVERSRPPVAAGQVGIDVYAAGVNFGDALIIQSLRPGNPATEHTPGYEVSGVIGEVGAGVSGFAVGDRVVAFCGTGGYAEAVTVDARFVYPMPAPLDFAAAAGFLAVYGTAYHALHERARLQPGETLLVLGAAGGAGLAAVEVGRAMGAHVIAAASTEAKRALCQERGAHDLMDYSQDGLAARLRQFTGQKGVNVVYDPVGGDQANELISAMAPEGRYLVIGFASGSVPQIPAHILLSKEVAAIGVYWGQSLAANPARNKINISVLFNWYLAGKIHPLVSEKYPLKDAGLAMRRLLARQAQGKIVLTINH